MCCGFRCLWICGFLTGGWPSASLLSGSPPSVNDLPLVIVTRPMDSFLCVRQSSGARESGFDSPAGSLRLDASEDGTLPEAIARTGPRCLLRRKEAFAEQRFPKIDNLFPSPRSRSLLLRDLSAAAREKREA